MIIKSNKNNNNKNGKSNLKFNIIDKLTDLILKKAPDFLTGNKENIIKKAIIIKTEKECLEYVNKIKTKNAKIYSIIIISLIILLMISGISIFDNDLIKTIKRPEQTNGNAIIPVEISISYDKNKFKMTESIIPGEKLLNEKEKRQLIDEYWNNIANIIKGKNKNLDKISQNLNLKDYDENTGISISWSSDNKELINDKGEVYLFGKSNKKVVNLKAKMNLDNVIIEKTIKVRITDKPDKAVAKAAIKGEIEQIIKDISEEGSSEIIYLPSSINKDLKIEWRNKNSVQLGNLILMLLILLAIAYFRRYEEVNKEIKKAQDNIINELPEFINKMVLLLNAGMVISSAIEKTIEDHNRFLVNYNSIGYKSNYFYDELTKIQNKVKQTNVSLISEILLFSKKSSVREFIRISSIIYDNWNKGSLLAEKMEEERELLWLNRKKRAEEKGKIAETKLTLPLMILLIVIIMITIAPAFMEM